MPHNTRHSGASLGPEDAPNARPSEDGSNQEAADDETRRRPEVERPAETGGTSTAGTVGQSSTFGAGSTDHPAPAGTHPDYDSHSNSVQGVLDWVQQDSAKARDRATYALAQERKRDNPRTTLIGGLEKLIGTEGQRQ
jgi:hypothetical protein